MRDSGYGTATFGVFAFAVAALLAAVSVMLMVLSRQAEYRITWDDADHICGTIYESHLFSGYTEIGQYCQPGTS